MIPALIELCKDSSASTLVEYGIAFALISAAATAILYGMGATTNTAYSNVTSNMQIFQNAPPP
jgi:Flp pilus assembly pilin Flp